MTVSNADVRTSVTFTKVEDPIIKITVSWPRAIVAGYVDIRIWENGTSQAAKIEYPSNSKTFTVKPGTYFIMSEGGGIARTSIDDMKIATFTPSPSTVTVKAGDIGYSKMIFDDL